MVMQTLHAGGLEIGTDRIRSIACGYLLKGPLGVEV